MCWVGLYKMWGGGVGLGVICGVGFCCRKTVKKKKVIKSGPLSWVIGWIYRRLAEVQDKIMVWVKLIGLWSWYSTKKLWSQKNKSCVFWSFKWQDGRMQSERTSIRHTTLCTTQDVAQRKSRGQRGQQRQRETGGLLSGFGSGRWMKCTTLL